MKNLFFLISESTIGTHLKQEDENVIFVEMKIPLNLKKTSDGYVNNTSLKNNENFIFLLNGAKTYEYDNIYFIIGFDADLQGEYMSNVLRDELLLNGIKETNIIRMPFCGDNYLAISNFMDLKDFMFFKGLENKFLAYLKKHNSNNKSNQVEVMSFRKIISLLELYENKESEFDISNSGTNTFTYITNKLYKNSIASKENLHNWIPNE